MAGSCERGNEIPDSLKRRELFAYLNGYELLKDTAPLTSLTNELLT
jgi:hypothetical protein